MQRIRKAGWTVPASGALCLLTVLCLAPASPEGHLMTVQSLRIFGP